MVLLVLLCSASYANPFLGAQVACHGQCLLIDAQKNHVESLGTIKGTSWDLPIDAFMKMGGECDRLALPRMGSARRSFLAHDIVRFKNEGDSSAASSARNVRVWAWPSASLMAASPKALQVSSLEGKFEFDFEKQEDLGGVLAFSKVKMLGALARAYAGTGGATSGAPVTAAELRVSMSTLSDCFLEYPQDP